MNRRIGKPKSVKGLLKMFDTLIMEQLADLKYKQDGYYEAERGSIFRKYYQHCRGDNVKMIISFIYQKTS